MAQVPMTIDNNTGLPVLVDSRERPLRREQLGERTAGPMMSGVRSILSGHPWQNIDPVRLTRLLRNAENGSPLQYLELAEEMEEKDPHYNSVLGTRKRAVAQMTIRVEPADDSAEAKADAALVEQWLDRDTLETELFDILDAIGKGYSFTEIVWDTTPGRPMLPRELVSCDPRHFEFDKVDGTTPLLIGEGGTLEPLDPAKFIHHVHSAKTGLPVRGGLARIVAWGAMFKNYAIKDWVSFLELYGVPMRVGRFDVGAHEDDIRKLMRAVSQVGTDATAVYPRTMDIEFIDGKLGTSPSDLWKSLAQYIDDQNSKVVLGQTSSSDAKSNGLGSGQANLHGEVRDDLKRADARLLAATINRDAVYWIVRFNRPGAIKFPRVKIEQPDPVDVKSTADAAKAYQSMGGKVSASKLREMLALPAPESDEDILEAPAATPEIPPQDAPGAPNGAKGRKIGAPRLSSPLRGQKQAVEALASALESPNRHPDPVDRATDEVLGDWEEMLDALLDPIAEDLATMSVAEVQASLAGKLATMDSAAFAGLMERLGFAAALAGIVDVKADQDAAK